MRPSLIANAVLAAAMSIVSGAEPAPSFRLDNGLWFAGSGFDARTVWVVEGRITSRHPGEQADQVIDLAGGYVIPPLCEGHNHNLGNTADQAEVTGVIDAYMEHGVFYAVMHGSFKRYRDEVSHRLNTPNSVDVVFANNGITGSGGHPRGLREFLFERYDSYPDFTLETLADAGYFEVETKEDLLAKFKLVLEEQPDLIKAMLLYSEEYDRRRDDPEFFGERGLNPALLPALVKLAHDAGLRVSVHVETEADLVTALQSGADIIAHLPSHDKPLRLSDAAIELAARSGAELVTTLSLADRGRPTEPKQYDLIIEVQKDNLRRLHEAGARLVIGSDNVRGISFGEAAHIADLGVLETSEILTMWTQNCARMAYPDRRIGRLDDEYEASFVVLDANPLEDLAVIPTNQVMSMKEGVVIRQLTETASESP